MRAVTIGAHVLDVHAMYVESIPEGQGGQLIEQIRMSPAGAAGGTAITLAKLGAEVLTVGAAGRDDLGDLLVSSLGKLGVDTSRIARRDDVQTSSSVIPVRPNGDRPAFHVIGANATLTADDVPWDELERADLLHLGGPEFLHELAPELLRRAREGGAITSVDMLADGWPELLDMVGASLPHVDWFLPNREQALALTGKDDVVEAGQALLERGVGGAAITCGAEGSVVVTSDGSIEVPAFEIEVVDTTGCGDAFSAGFLFGVADGASPEEAARFGSACAALVAQGLGSDAGDFDLETVREYTESR